MSKTPFLLLCILLTSYVSPVSAQSRSSVTFVLSVEENILPSYLLRVTAEFSNTMFLKELRLALGPTQAGYYYPVGIQFVKVIDSQNRDLKVERKPQTCQFQLQFNRCSTPEIWSIANTGASNSVHIEYLLALRYWVHDSVDGYLGFAGPSYVMSWAGWVFLLPQEDQWRASFDGSIHVKVRPPNGWNIVTPWVEDVSGEYVDPDYYHFQRSTFSVGLFEVEHRQIHGTEVTVAVHKSFNSTERELISGYSFAAFDRVYALFQAKTVERYLSVYVPKPERLETGKSWIIGTLEASDSQGIGFASSYSPDLIHEFTHRIFHTWNGFPPYGMSQRSNEESWFVEGTDQYYDDKILQELGAADEESFLASYYSFYLTEILGTKNDVALAAVNTGRDPYPLWRLPYNKGALVSFMLDQLMSKVSGGKASLDDVLAVVYKNFHGMKCCVSNADIMQAARQLTGIDLSTFSKVYIYTNERLPLEYATEHTVEINWSVLLGKLGISNVPIISLNLTREQAQIGGEIPLTATVLTSNGNPMDGQVVTLQLDRHPIANSTTDHNGRAEFKVLLERSNSTRGTHNLTLYYQGRNGFVSQTTTKSFQVIGLQTILNAEYNSGNSTLNAQLTEADGSPIAGATVLVSVNSLSAGSASTDSLGKASLKLSIDAGAMIKLSFSGDPVHEPSEVTFRKTEQQTSTIASPTGHPLGDYELPLLLLSLAVAISVVIIWRRIRKSPVRSERAEMKRSPQGPEPN